MSAMAELSTHLVEFGGDLHTRGGWLARDAAGRVVDGYRYARFLPCESRACAGAACDVCAWEYVGRTFAPDDAVDALVEILEAAQLEQTARDIMPARRPGDVATGRAVWDGATGEWQLTYGRSSTIGGPSHLSSLADSLRRHGFTSGGWQASGGIVRGTLYARDWSEAP